MDLNHLLYRHQVSLMQADAANSVEARYCHRGRAALYAERIAEVRQGLLMPVVAAF
jgi:hypothetical protein